MNPNLGHGYVLRGVITGAVFGLLSCLTGCGARSNLAEQDPPSRGPEPPKPTCHPERPFSARWGDDDAQIALSISFDPSGDFLLAGVFHGEVDLGEKTLSNPVLPPTLDGFMARLDPEGNAVWTKRFPGLGKICQVDPACAPWNLWMTDVDGRGDTVLGANFARGIDFGAGTTDGATANIEAALTKYDSAGAPRWSHRLKAKRVQISQPVLDAQGNTFVAGVAEGEIRYGDTPIGGSPAGDRVDFLLTLDPAGHVLWSKMFKLSPLAYGLNNLTFATPPAAAHLGSAGDVVLIGEIDMVADLGGGPLGVKDAQRGFVASYDAAGGHRLSTTLAGSVPLPVHAAVDATGAVVIVDIPAVGVASVTRIDASGALDWQRPFMATPSLTEASVAIDHQGNAIVAGYFAGTVDLGQGPMDTGGDAQAMFAAALDPAGDLRWARRVATTSTAFIGAPIAAVDPCGSPWLTGGIAGIADLGQDKPTTGENYSSDIFAMKLVQ